MLTLIMWRNRFIENQNEAVEAHIPQHWDSKTKKPRHWDSRSKKPRHRETETINPLRRDSKTFFQRTKSHDVKIPRLKSHYIEFPRNSDPYAPWQIEVVSKFVDREREKAKKWEVEQRNSQRLGKVTHFYPTNLAL